MIGLNAYENNINQSKNLVGDVSMHHDFFFFHFFEFFFLPVFFQLSEDVRAMLSPSISSLPCLPTSILPPELSPSLFSLSLNFPFYFMLLFSSILFYLKASHHNIRKLGFNYYLAHFIEFINCCLKDFNIFTSKI